jgi:dCMP deaminase
MSILNCTSRPEKWDKRFLDLSKLVSTWSKDPSTQVGAAIVDPTNKIISIGYNGFSMHTKDDERLNDRDTKYKMIIHAECNALMFARSELTACTLYTYPFMPCPKCACLMIQAGIIRVVSYNNMPERWKNDFELSKQILLEADVDLTLYSEY